MQCGALTPNYCSWTPSPFIPYSLRPGDFGQSGSLLRSEEERMALQRELGYYVKGTREVLQASKQRKSNAAHLPRIQEKYDIT